MAYATNGNDYWFLSTIDLKRAAILSLMDYFNGTYKLKKYRSILEESHVVSNDDLSQHDSRSVLKYLWDKGPWCLDDLRLDEVLDMTCFDDLSVPELECHCPRVCSCGSLKRCSCPAEMCAENVDFFNESVQRLRPALSRYSFAIFDGSIRFNMQDLVVGENCIYFETTGYQEHIMFALCRCEVEDWFHYVENPVHDEEFDSKLGHTPPIHYVEFDDGYHLIVDMFNNGLVDKTMCVPFFENPH